MCDFSENDKKCGKEKCYGEYCNKHKKNYLLQNDLIVLDRFTSKPADYLKGDILNTINTY